MPGGAGRDLFPGHNVGAGKGDASRHKLDDAWRANYDEIDFSGSCTEFVAIGPRTERKVYPRPRLKLYETD